MAAFPQQGHSFANKLVASVWYFPEIVAPQYKPQNTIVLIKGPPKWYPQFEKPHFFEAAASSVVTPTSSGAWHLIYDTETLIKEYTLNGTKVPNIKQAIFLHQGVWAPGYWLGGPPDTVTDDKEKSYIRVLVLLYYYYHVGGLPTVLIALGVPLHCPVTNTCQTSKSTQNSQQVTLILGSIF